MEFYPPSGRGLPGAEVCRACELHVARNALSFELTAPDGGAYGAGRLSVMPAIAKFAGERQGLDVVEIGGGILTGIPQLYAAHTRRIDDGPATRTQKQLAMRCRMAPAAVMGADLLGRLSGAPQQRVRQRRLANAGRADETDGPVAIEIPLEGGDPVAGAGADGIHGNTWGNGGDLLLRSGDVVGEIRLVEDDHRGGAAIGNQRQQPFDARQIKIAVGRCHD